MPLEPERERPAFPRPTPVRADPPHRAQPPDYLPARMLNEFVYCPRLFFYEWVEGLFAHSADTLEGAFRHEKLERREDGLPRPEEAGEEKIHSRSVMLASDSHRLIARIDLIEGEGGRVTPVDYKRGSPRHGEQGLEAWPADRVQLSAQALILRDNGYACDEGVVYYNETKQRVRVAIDDRLVAETLSALAAGRAVAEAGRIPPPLVDSPKCPRCSLVGICLPDETLAALRARDQTEGRQLALFEPAEPAWEVPARPEPEEVRRLVPARDDLRPLYVAGYGYSLGKSGDVLQVREKGQLLQEVRIKDISQVNILGSVSVSSAAVQGLCEAEKIGRASCRERV